MNQPGSAVEVENDCFQINMNAIISADYSDFLSEISVMLATQLMTRARGLPVDP